MLKTIILNPDALSSLKDSSESKSQKIYKLTRKSPQGLFHILVVNYLHHTAGIDLDITDRIPSQLVTWATNTDHLYYEVAELYKEATDKVPPIIQTQITNGGALINIKHPKLNSEKPPLVIITNPKINDGVLTIDPMSELMITIIHSE